MDVNQPGIYKIINTLTGDIYVGSTRNLVRRKCNHFDALRRGVHHSIYLQRACAKYGIDNFTFEVIEEMKFPVDYEPKLIAEHLVCREQYYMDTLAPMYNILKEAGQSRLGTKFTPEQLNKRIGKKYGRSHKVYEMDTDFNLLRTFDRVNYCAEAIGKSKAHVSICIMGDRVYRIGKNVYIGEQEYKSGKFKDSRKFRHLKKWT